MSEDLTGFCCFASGENFPGELDGRNSLVGFFVSVFLNASSSSEAEAKASEMLLAHFGGTGSETARLPDGATIKFKVTHDLERQVEPKVTEFQYFEMDE